MEKIQTIKLIVLECLQVQNQILLMQNQVVHIILQNILLILHL